MKNRHIANTLLAADLLSQIKIKMRSYKNELSAEELIVYVARVSNPSNQLNSETSDKLIAYMVKNKHWSPFSLCNIKNSNSAGN